MLAMGYLVSQEVHREYRTDGFEYFRSDLFWNQFNIPYPQVLYDVQYLYGLLLSANNKRQNPHLVRHKQDMNGLEVWLKFEASYAYGGSKTMKSEELKDNFLKRYDSRAY